MVSLGGKESERVAERVEIKLRERVNWTEPSNLQACWKAVAFVKEIFGHISPGALGGSQGVVSGVVSRVSEVHTSIFGDGGGDIRVGISVVCAWNVMLLIAQSINGLYRASQ